MSAEYKYTPTDFKTDGEIKWCPGCGDHAILNAVVKVLPEVSAEQDIPHENFAFISGIGCSSRFPYYMKTYGMHTIHGRAAAIATGVKVGNPALSVWQATGDGDALAIGGNHFIHAVRRNIDLNIMLFNNEIYGLTKGQYSPTSKFGKVTKTSPFGTVEQPFNPGKLTIGAGGTFFARSIDVDIAGTQAVLLEGSRHKGTSIVEILQNCVIFNDKTHGAFAGSKELREENTILLKHGEKMLFGKERNKGLSLDGLTLKVVELGKDGITEADILTHDAKTKSPILHLMLAAMKYPEYPVAIGVIREVEAPAYDTLLAEQIKTVQSTSPIKNMDDLLNSGDTWEI